MHLPLWPCVDVLDSALNFVQQGQHITRITRIPWGHERGEDKTGRGFRGDAGLSPTLRRAITLAFNNRGNGGIVGVDQFTVVELLAVGKPCRLLPDVVMVAHRRGERQRETLTLRLAQGDRVFEALLGLEASGLNGLTQCKELVFGLTHQRHEDAPLPSATATKAPHDLGEGVLQVLGLVVEWDGPAVARLRDVGDERKHFFCALDSVVASVTR